MGGMSEGEVQGILNEIDARTEGVTEVMLHNTQPVLFGCQTRTNHAIYVHHITHASQTQFHAFKNCNTAH